MVFSQCATCLARQAVFQYWQQRLKADGLGPIPLIERYWDTATQKTCQVLSLETFLARSDSPDKDRLLPSVNPFEGSEPSLDELIATLPSNIADVLRLDYRRRTRQQKERLAAWRASEGRRLLKQFGFM